MANYYGSICLSNIPRELIKEVTCKDGVVRKYLNINIVERKTPSDFGHTHFISCQPKQEERKEGVNYIIGDLRTSIPREQSAQPAQGQPSAPSSEQQPSAPFNDDLPF